MTLIIRESGKLTVFDPLYSWFFFSKENLHEISSVVQNTDDVNFVVFKVVKCGIISTDQIAIRYFYVYDRRKRRTRLRKIAKLTDSRENLADRFVCGCRIAKLLGDIGFDFLQIGKCFR